MTLYPALTLSVAIARPYPEVAAYLAKPERFPDWASGLGRGFSALDDGTWRVETPEGAATVRFSPANDFGVADHWVRLPDGSTVYIPLRVLRNHDGSEVTLTLFRLPAMDDARFAADCDWVRRDLETLRAVLEAK